MTNAREQQTFENSIREAGVILLGAVLMILTGIMFQLGELGYGHVGAANFWLVSVIGESAWDLLAVRLNAPEMQEALRFWPLLLVGLGLAILMVQKGKMALGLHSPSQSGETRGE